MMDCEKVLELLDDLVDAELQLSDRDQVREHIAGCKRCDARYRESIELKRLVARRAFHPSIPGGLSSRIVQDIRARSGVRSERAAAENRFRTVVTALAASVLALTVGALILSIILPAQPPLGHADVAGAVGKKYENLPSVSPGSAGGAISSDLDRALHAIQRDTGVTLTSLPDIGTARPVSWSPDEVLGHRCVRLVYAEPGETIRAGARPEIVVYAIPVSEAGWSPPGPEREHYCPCDLRQGANVFCFRYAEASMNVVTTLSPEEMRTRLKEIEIVR